MIPVIPELENTVEEVSYPTKDFAIVISDDKMGGFVDEIDSVKQVAYLILNTERFDHIIYSWDYGVELKSLIGQPKSYVISEVKRRIEDALLQDDRILGCDNFEIEIGKRSIHVKLSVITSYGSFDQELEVVN